ncbi:hypothetical protein H4R35_002292 [Dimargaris xerosporica]|nr:hypothetical protein H4R35_002292 [Dimargaris xerosporica]
MVLSPSYPEREVEPEAVEQLLQAATVIPSPEGPASSNRTHWRGKLSGHQYRSVTAVTSELSRGTTISGYLMAQPNDPESLLSPPDVVSRLGRMGLTAEWLFILRPLIYVLAIRRWGPKSWVPWLLSLAIELGSRSLMNQRAGAHRLFGTRSQLEESELSRRTWLLLYYVLRSPFYERFTKPRLDGLIKTTSTKPLISLFTGILADYQPLWESVYFYTSGS